MLTKSFFSPPKPSFRYELLSKALPQPVVVAPTKSVTLLLPDEKENGLGGALKIGDRIKTGQIISSPKEGGGAVLSSVTGTVSAMAPYLGDYGRKYTAITIDTEKRDEWDDQFAANGPEPDARRLGDYLSTAPGCGPFSKLCDPKQAIHTVVIYGGDTDLLVETNLFILKGRIDMVNAGIEAIKKATGVRKVILAVPGESFQNFDGHFAADEVFAVPNVYPGGQPLMVYFRLFGKILEQGRTFEDNGVLFLTAEAVASVGKAFKDGRPPVEKVLTVFDKKGNKRLVLVRIGTPIGDILKALTIPVKNKDRLILGGPMTGTAAYSLDQPVMPNTDALMVQDGEDIIHTSDYPCINCGECVRICPAGVQVNMLIRFLEANQYQDGADLYDLYSCVECGLCGVVCPSRIPILQFIRLAKFELARMTSTEEENE